jgi:uroporphyrin-III C-methyltransferase/precorrin-2 dehydrogenase/sirohydrochlorin ferrochelatase
MYPISLNLEGKRCLVVGGGGVALRKIDGLVEEGARVTVIARAPCAGVEKLAEAGEIELHRRPYEVGEASSFALVMAATDDREINRQVFEDADGAGIWANVADDPPLCTFHLPARVRRGTLQIGIASAGEAPFAVRRLRQGLEKRLGEEWGEWMEAAARFRGEIRRLDLPLDEAEDRYDQFFSATVDLDRMRARVPTEAEEVAWLSGGEEGTQADPSKQADPSTPASRPHGGKHLETGEVYPLPGQGAGLVSLIGGGPGDPGLLTMRGRQRLLAADAVVYDRLAKTVLPCDLDPRVELHSVGKEEGHHPVPQEEINRLLVRLAREGKRVARLKGGDPFVFGRGGEEALALRQAGVPFEVVPSVTAGVAAPAYAGIPVTQRNEVVRLTLVTAHESIKSDGPQVRWDLLGQDAHATLVGYMGVSSLPNVARKLVDGGMDPDTPAAMIERGTTPAQRVVVATVSTLAERIQEAAIKPPALFVIGPTVRHFQEMDWFSSRPLAGARIGVVAPARALGELLELGGAEVVEVPLPLTPAARVVLGAVPITGWILRHLDEVDALDEERDSPGWTAETVTWTVGPEVTDRARNREWRHVVELPVAGDPAEAVAAIRATRQPPPGDR